jgi:hypothetical protein
MIASVIFAVLALVTGNIDSADALRTVLGVTALWFALPLIASAARPLRREPAEDNKQRFDRIADFVLIALIGSWAALKAVGALPGLAGMSLPLAGHAKVVALWVLGALIIRVLLESVSANFYPERLRAVTPEKIPFSSPLQRILATFLRLAIFIFVAIAFIGNCWQLWVGAVLFVVPQILKIYENSFPNVSVIYNILPRGLLKVLIFMVIGKFLGDYLGDHVSNPLNMILIAFVVMSIPGFIESILGLFGRDGKEYQWNWLTRFGGTAILVVTYMLAMGIIGK